MDYLPKTNSSFYMSGKKYEGNDKDLIRYSEDLYKSNEELKSYHKFQGFKQRFDYIQPFKMRDGKFLYRTHDNNIERFFKLFTNKELYDTLKPITKTEANHMTKTYNAGLQFSVKGQYESYGYDFSNHYGSILASKQLKIPTKQGKEYKLDVLPSIDMIQFGYYKVLITSDDPDVKKIFAFSKNGIYTHYDLKYALRLKELHIVINIELNTEDEFNCYIYNKDDLICGKDLFGEWYETIIELKKLFPKNILIKMLSSSLWGHLSRANILYVSEEEGDKLNIGTTDECDYMIKEYNYNSDGSTFYKLHDMNKPYKYPLRLKPFLTALGRNKTANVALLEIDSVLRIHTDGVVFDKPFEHEIPNFIPEDKTTGLIQWNNINNYLKL
jgi:hypothetical protein